MPSVRRASFRVCVGLAIVAAQLSMTGSAAAQEPENGSMPSPSRLWLLGNVGLGGGSGPFQGLYAVAAAGVTVWPLNDVDLGLNGVVGAVAAGAPDGPGSEGRFFGGGISARTALDQSAHPWWAFVSASVGSASVSGYEDSSDSSTNFDTTDWILSFRAGFVGSVGPLLVGVGVEYDTMPGHGWALAIPALFAGFEI